MNKYNPRNPTRRIVLKRVEEIETHYVNPFLRHLMVPINSLVPTGLVVRMGSILLWMVILVK